MRRERRWPVQARPRSALAGPGPAAARALSGRRDRDPRRRYRMFQGIRRSRMFGWDGNPLRRRADRLEAGVLAGLIMALLIGAPIMVAIAGHWAQAAGMRALRAEATWTQVSATVQRSAPVQSSSFSGPEGTVWMQGHWMAPDGQPRSGRIATRPGFTAGATTRIWVNRAGSPVKAPQGRSQLLGWTPIAEVGTALALVILFSLAVYAERRLFRRSRLADWHRAWRAEGPRWTGQR